MPDAAGITITVSDVALGTVLGFVAQVIAAWLKARLLEQRFTRQGERLGNVEDRVSRLEGKTSP